MLAPDTILQNRYRIIRRLAQGGMGAVYEAKDLRLGPLVALKELLLYDQVLRHAFEREARVLAHLRHPALPNVIDHFVEGQGQYLVMEYIAGHDLGDLLKQGKIFSVSEVQDLANHLLEALEYLHSQQPPVIHRDIKPANLKLTPSGKFFLLDFGLAKSGVGWTNAITMNSNSLYGYTLSYAPLEQIEGSGTDARSDLYALAATLYHLLTGSIPPSAMTRAHADLKHVADPLRPANEVNLKLSSAVAMILTKGLALNANDRFDSAAQMRVALQEAIDRSLKSAIATATVHDDKPNQALIETLPNIAPTTRQDKPSQGTNPTVSREPNPARNRPKPLVILTIVLISLTISLWATSRWQTGSTYSCQDTFGCVEIGPGEPIQIASLLAISGSSQPLGVDSQRAIDIVLSNRQSIEGHEILHISQDEKCHPDNAHFAAQQIIANLQIVAVVGTSCSASAEAAIPLLTKAGLTMISPTNTAPSLTAKNRNPNYAGYLRTAHNDQLQGALAADYAFNQLKARTAVTISNGSVYADSLQLTFVETFRQLGGKITSQEQIKMGQSDVLPLLTELALNPPDVLYYPVFTTEAAIITSQARRNVSELEKTALMMSNSAFSITFAQQVGPAAVGSYISAPFVRHNDYDAFIETYRQKYGEPFSGAYHAHAADATHMILDALEKVAIKDPNGSLYIGRQALREALFATKDFNGLTGQLTCNRTGDCATGEALAIFQVRAKDIVNPDMTWPPPPIYQRNRE